VTYSESAKKSFGERLDQVKPDVVHVHNFFPLFTPSIYDACRDRRVPIVQSLHNFRLTCANGLFLREGKICEDCLGGSPLPGVVHGCYRNSRIASAVLARMISHHRKAGTWSTKVNRFIASTEFTRTKLIQAGVPAEKFVIKPNFIFGPKPENFKPTRHYPRSTALYVGRLGEEKGITTLLRAWKGLDIPLRVVGDGPMMGELRKFENPNIAILGRLPKQQDVWKEMSECDFLVIPSDCYENFPLTVAEGFANGIPIIGSRLGSMGGLIENGVSGLLFTNRDSDELRRHVQALAENREKTRQMGLNARRVYEEKFTPERNYEVLSKIYRDVVEENARQTT
jgi:glycosyltransferase involved in cell wall biosynthesis